MEGSGCYGHNGADDAGADAALLAMAFPGRPVRVQWMREQEHAWEPYGSAMVAGAGASLDPQGNVADWQYDVWSRPIRRGPARRQADAGLASRESRLRRPPRSPSRSRRAAATVMPSRSTIRRPRALSIISSRKCRCGFRRCGRWRLHERVLARELHGRAGWAAGINPVEFRLRTWRTSARGKW